jgi:hypothetical protein
MVVLHREVLLRKLWRQYKSTILCQRRCSPIRGREIPDKCTPR